MAHIKDIKNIVQLRPEKLRDQAQNFKLPDRPKVGPEILDKFGSAVLNKVMRNLKSMLSLKAERGMELAAKRQMAEVARESGKGLPPTMGPMVVRGGQVVGESVQAGKVQTPVSAGVGNSAAMISGEPQKTGEPQKKDLTLFEKVFLARFEGGQSIGEPSEPGRQHFLAKSAEGWRGFFSKFLPFTVQKKASAADLQAVVYRGVVPEEKGSPGRSSALLVSDLKFQARTDKFARLEVPNQSLLSKIASRMPGEVLEKALLSEWMASMGGASGGQEFSYLAVSHRIVQPEMVRSMGSEAASQAARLGEADRGSSNPAVASALNRAEQGPGGSDIAREPERGIALTARAEQMAAEQLEIDWRRGGSREAADTARAVGGEKGAGSGMMAGLFRGRRRKGLFGNLWGDQDLSSGSVFVPWYQQILRFKKYPGRPRWYVVMTYFVGAAAVFFLTVYVFRFLLQR